MSTLLDFNKKREAKTSGDLVTCANLIDRGIRYILSKPHVTKREIVGVVAQRLGKLISIMPHDTREEMLSVAWTTIQKYYKERPSKKVP